VVDRDRERKSHWKLQFLKVKGRSVGMSGIRRIKTVLPSPVPVKIVASITLPSIYFTHSLVPLQSFGGSRFRSIKLEIPL
jgi:hypothetical protein